MYRVINMSGITLAIAQEQLSAWLTANLNVAGGGQSYTFSDQGVTRTVTRADVALIQKQIQFWQAQVNKLTTTRKRFGTIRANY